MEGLMEKRLKICKECPIYKIDKFYGPICDNSKYISPDGKSASYFKKDGWIRGCGCKLRYKASNVNSHCISGKW